jgi:hypothetical protein
MNTENVKNEARRLLDRMPDDVTWDELMHEIYVRQSIEAGLADSKAGQIVDVKTVRERFGLPSGTSSGLRLSSPTSGHP